MEVNGWDWIVIPASPRYFAATLSIRFFSCDQLRKILNDNIEHHSPQPQLSMALSELLGLAPQHNDKLDSNHWSLKHHTPSSLCVRSWWGTTSSGFLSWFLSAIIYKINLNNKQSSSMGIVDPLKVLSIFHVCFFILCGRLWLLELKSNLEMKLEMQHTYNKQSKSSSMGMVDPWCPLPRPCLLLQQLWSLRSGIQVKHWNEAWNAAHLQPAI